MKLTVHLFARARDIAGTSPLMVELDEPATVGMLRRHLESLLPNLGPLLAHSAIAVDNEFAGDTCPLTPGAEVALLPPVSGG